MVVVVTLMSLQCAFGRASFDYHWVGQEHLKIPSAWLDIRHLQPRCQLSSGSGANSANKYSKSYTIVQFVRMHVGVKVSLASPPPTVGALAPSHPVPVLWWRGAPHILSAVLELRRPSVWGLSHCSHHAAPACCVALRLPVALHRTCLCALPTFEWSVVDVLQVL
jgi:hypothetical protein